MPKTCIAVVEDNPDNRLLVQAILKNEYDVVEYADGQSALEGFAQRVPDIVLLDISLPGMDGTEVLATMRRDPRLGCVPVIALTAHAMEEDRDQYLEAGFDGYVTKPILDEEILLRAIADTFRR